MLLLTCVWIIYEAGKRLFFHHVEIEPSIAAFVVMFVSMAVDFWRSRALGKIAAEYDQALKPMRCTSPLIFGRAELLWWACSSSCSDEFTA